MQELWCSLYPEEHGGFVAFNDLVTCPECGSEVVPKEEIE